MRVGDLSSGASKLANALKQLKLKVQKLRKVSTGRSIIASYEVMCQGGP